MVPPYDRLSDPLGEPPAYDLLAGSSVPTNVGTPAYLGRLADFDYVLLLNAGAAEASGPWSEGLELVRKSDVAALYRVRRD